MTTRTADFLSIIERGLPPAVAPKKVIVVGAGMAGLVAAYELQRAGHEVVILEARPRVGGRIYTMREAFSPGLHAEAGAMRVPEGHTLTMAYIRTFNLNLLPFTMHNPRAYHYVRDQKYRIARAAAHLYSLGYELAPHEQGKSHTQLWEETVLPIKQRLDTLDEAGREEVYAEYDRFSTRGTHAHVLRRVAALRDHPFLHHHVPDRGWHGPPAAGVSAGAAEPHPLWLSGDGDGPDSGLGDDLLSNAG